MLRLHYGQVQAFFSRTASSSQLPSPPRIFPLGRFALSNLQDCRRCTPHNSTARATAQGPGPEENGRDDHAPVDIDQLAKQLAKEAARLRSSEPEEDPGPDRPPSVEDAVAPDIAPVDNNEFLLNQAGAFGDEVSMIMTPMHKCWLQSRPSLKMQGCQKL